MKTRKLRDIEVSAIGMGCMGFTHAYGDAPEESKGIQLVHEAFDLGCNFFDTAEMYSYFKNEEFLGKAIKVLPRDKVIISDKFWPTPLPGMEMPEGKLSEAGIRRSLEASLKRLGIDYIDLYTEHQMAEGNEEEVAFVMGKLIQEGKIRAWGQSSPSMEQIRKAHAVTPITAIQSEFSMMERKWENTVIPLCGELNIGFVAFAPMANGFLSGKIAPDAVYAKNDIRNVITRFNPENIEANEPVVELVERFSIEKHCTAAQISLAWVLKTDPYIVPIPGMRSSARIKENLGAADIELTDKEYTELTDALNKLKIHGNRDGKDIKKLGTVPQNVDR